MLSNSRFADLNPFNYADNVKLASCQTAGCFCSKSTSATCRTYAYLNTVYCFCAEESATTAAYTANDENKGQDIDKLIETEKENGRYKNYRLLSGDPCLVYFDTNKELCARCKYGALRIVTASNKIVCGS